MDWYPHYIDDYDSDTVRLTIAEDGAYSRLLRWYYKNEKALPDDEVSLAGICRIGVEEWRALAPKIRPFFVTRLSRVTGDQVLLQKRCNEVITAQNKKRKDGKQRQEKLRKNGVLEAVTRDKRVGNAPRGEESRVEETLSLTDRTESPTTTEPSDLFARGSKKTEPAKPSKAQAAAEVDRLFEEVWAHYPRKVGKKPARKAFGAALARTQFPEILAGVIRYAAERANEDHQFTAHPASWLNGDRWTDQPPVRNGAGRSGGNGREPDSGVARFLNRHLGAGGQPDLPDLGGNPAGVSPVPADRPRPRPGPIPGFGPRETIVEPDGTHRVGENARYDASDDPQQG